ncbi:T9SS type B sorting domain-containing protein [Chitinophaga tropicalis]|nr:gliding motility-associated C-terminal domain-containing protein [Chitinophaga tropicalis]
MKQYFKTLLLAFACFLCFVPGKAGTPSNTDLGPALTLTGPIAISGGVYTFQVTASEEITGFSVSDVNVLNVTISNATKLSPTTYTFTITTFSSTPKTLNMFIGSNTVTSVATGDLNLLPSNTLAITVDASIPTLQSVSPPTGKYYKLGQDLDFTVTYDENVVVNTTDPPSLPLTVGSRSVQATYLSGSGTQNLVFRYTAADGDEDIDGVTLGSSITANTGVIKDVAGHNAPTQLNNVGSTSGVKVSTHLPSVALSTIAPVLVNGSFNVTAVFSEEVSGLSAGSFSITNATSILSTSDNTTYQLAITPSSDGVINISLPAGQAENFATNVNSASNVLTVTADITAPAISSVIPPAARTYKLSEALAFILEFSEPVTVTGTPTIPLTIGGRTETVSYQSGSGTNQLTFSYTVQEGDNDNVVILPGTNVILNGGVITDIANNPAILAIPSATIGYVNGIHPTISLSGPAKVTTSTFTFTLTASEAISGLDATDFILSGIPDAVISNITAVDASTMTIEVTLPQVTGADLTIYLPENTVTGVNDNEMSNILTIPVDNVPPAVTQVYVSSPGYYNATQTLYFAVYFSEDVTVNAASLPLTIGNKTVSAAYISGSGSNTLVFSYQVQDGDMDMDGIAFTGTEIIPDNSGITDQAGNNADLHLNNADPVSGIFVNTTHPDVTLSTATTVVTASFTVNIDFTEEVTDFTGSDFILTNASVTEPQSTDGIHYTVEVTPDSDGAVSVSLPAGAALNIGLNGNNAPAGSINVMADLTDPAVTKVDVPASGYYNTNRTLTFTVHYSEAVIVDTTAGVPYMAINLDSTAVPATFSGGSGTNTLTFSYTVQDGDMDTDGISLDAGISLGGGGHIQDAAGNYALLVLNNVADPSGIFINTAHPDVTLSTTAVSPLNTPFIVTVAFTEAVTGLAATDFTVVNGTASDLQTSGNTTYTIKVTPAADGTVSIALPANTTVNVGQNGNNASNTISAAADITAPVINAGQTFTARQYSTTGTTVGTPAATETFGTLQNWTITSDNSGGAFAINATTGVISVKDSVILNSKTGTVVTLGITVSDGLNTSQTGTVNINVTTVPLPPTDINIDNTVINERSAVGTLVGNLSTVTNEPGATFTYTLVTGAGSDDNNSFLLSSNQLQTAAVLSTQTKTVYNVRIRATDNNGLYIEEAFVIQLNFINQAPAFDIINDQAICYTAAVQTIQLTGVSATEGGQAVTLTVSADRNYFTTLTIDAAGKLSYSLQPGADGTSNISVSIKDDGGTANGGIDAFSRTFALTVNSLPVVTISTDSGAVITKGQTLNLTASGADSYSWTDADGIIGDRVHATLKVKPMVNTTYEVTGTTTNGCSSTALISISVNDTNDDPEIHAANVITPNGDGINDKWVVRNLESYPDNEVTIYDRSGRMVYRQRNYSNNWGGTVDGRPLAQGTYYYVLTISGSNKPVKGFITIIRD